ncbi:MAG: T9SS type A sorting domain-containing protein [Saprospiraceae bacterium]|nr:T9SS type A sorting domain-containing protein [Saprospiraceae bacterium]
MLLGMVSRCDSFTIDCGVLARTDLLGDTLWTSRIDWLDPGARAIDIKGDTLIMAGHNAPGLENFYLYFMSLEGDSIQAIEIYPPEGYYEVRIGGVIQYGNRSVVYGTAKEEGKPGFVSLLNWVNDQGQLDTIMVIGNGHISDNIWDVDIDPENILTVLNDKVDTTSPPNSYDIRRKQILKYNQDMDLVWEWETGNEFDFSNSLVGRMEVLDDGVIIIPAEDNSPFSEEVWGIDSTGIKWRYSHPFSPSVRISVYNLTEAANGDILGCGWISDNEITLGNMAYLFRMTNEGEMLWERAIIDSRNEVPDKPMVSYMFDITELDDGTILIGGYQNVWYYDENNEEKKDLDAWLVRTDANGCIIEDCEYVQDFTTSIPIFSHPIDITFFPNPTSNLLSIVWPEEFRAKEIQIYDSIGRLVLRDISPELNVQLDLSGIESGLYAVVLMDDLGRRYAEKVVVR